ncbi:MAG TPA: sigma-70 family RNA polymerase sigma factor [Acidimicrobiia bacterium]
MPSPGSGLVFDEWYRREWPRLVATFTLASGDRELGREIAAESLARALERWDRVGRMASPGGWTYRVGLNLLRRHHRRATTERRALQRIGIDADPTRASTEDVELWNAVADLPARQRSAVVLRYCAGMKEAEIAEVLGVAPGTVAATLNHARAQLRSVLTEPEGIDRERSR